MVDLLHASVVEARHGGRVGLRYVNVEDGISPGAVCSCRMEGHLLNETILHAFQRGCRNDELALSMVVNIEAVYRHITVGGGTVVHGKVNGEGGIAGCAQVSAVVVVVGIADVAHTKGVGRLGSEFLEGVGAGSVDVDGLDYLVAEEQDKLQGRSSLFSVGDVPSHTHHSAVARSGNSGDGTGGILAGHLRGEVDSVAVVFTLFVADKLHAGAVGGVLVEACKCEGVFTSFHFLPCGVGCLLVFDEGVVDIALPLEGDFVTGYIVVGELGGQFALGLLAGSVVNGHLGQEVLLAHAGAVAADRGAVGGHTVPCATLVCTGGGLVECDHQVAAKVGEGLAERDSHFIVGNAKTAAIDLGHGGEVVRVGRHCGGFGLAQVDIEGCIAPVGA